MVVFISFDHQIFDKGRESKRSKESVMAGNIDGECERSFNDNLRSMVPKGSPTSKDEGDNLVATTLKPRQDDEAKEYEWKREKEGR